VAAIPLRAPVGAAKVAPRRGTLRMESAFAPRIRRLQRHENVPRGNKRALCASRVPTPRARTRAQVGSRARPENSETVLLLTPLCSLSGSVFDTSPAIPYRSAGRGAGEAGIYIGENQHPIRDPKIIRRLARLAVPPAYADVLYAADPHAHLQAIGRDAAGRLQYRYHSRWKTCANCARAAVLPG